MTTRVQRLQRTSVAISGSLIPRRLPSWQQIQTLLKTTTIKTRRLVRNERLRTGLAIAIVPLSFAVPAVLSLLPHDTPAAHAVANTQTTSTTLPGTSITNAEAFSLKGINIGNDQSSTSDAPFAYAENESDLAYLKGKVSRIRIAVAYGADINDLTNLKRLAMEAKDDGFYVQFGITAGSDPDVNTYYNRWLSTDIVATAIWAQAHHIDEFAIGNEEDWHNMVQGAYPSKTPAEIRNDIRNKVADVRKVYSGLIVYADAEHTMDDWIKEGIGGLDRIYFNIYDTDSNFQMMVKKVKDNFGTAHGGIAEWATEHGYQDVITNKITPAQYAQDLMKRAAIIKASGLPAYLFTLRMSPDDPSWGLILGDGTRRAGLDQFLNS